MPYHIGTNLRPLDSTDFSTRRHFNTLSFSANMIPAVDDAALQPTDVINQVVKAIDEANEELRFLNLEVRP